MKTARAPRARRSSTSRSTRERHRAREPARARGARAARSTSCRRRRGACSGSSDELVAREAKRLGRDRGFRFSRRQVREAHGLGQHAAPGPPRAAGRAGVRARAPRRPRAELRVRAASTTAPSDARRALRAGPRGSVASRGDYDDDLAGSGSHLAGVRRRLAGRVRGQNGSGKRAGFRGGGGAHESSINPARNLRSRW